MNFARGEVNFLAIAVKKKYFLSTVSKNWFTVSTYERNYVAR